MPAKSTTGTQPEIALVCWRGELSTLQARLQLSPSEFVRLKKLASGTGNRLSIDVDLSNNAPVFSALRRRLAGGEGA